MGLFGKRGPVDVDEPDEIIDLRGDREAVVIDLVAMERARAVKRGVVQWGLPAPCPECGDAGYLDHIDMVGGVMYQHCPSCFEKWAITRDDIEAAAEIL